MEPFSFFFLRNSYDITGLILNREVKIEDPQYGYVTLDSVYYSYNDENQLTQSLQSFFYPSNGTISHQLRTIYTYMNDSVTSRLAETRSGDSGPFAPYWLYMDEYENGALSITTSSQYVMDSFIPLARTTRLYNMFGSLEGDVNERYQNGEWILQSMEVPTYDQFGNVLQKEDNYFENDVWVENDIVFTYDMDLLMENCMAGDDLNNPLRSPINRVLNKLTTVIEDGIRNCAEICV